MPKRPMIEVAPTPKPTAKRARSAVSAKKQLKSQTLDKPQANLKPPLEAAAPAAMRLEPGISRRTLLSAGFGVFAGGAAIGLGAARLMGMEGVATAGRNIVAFAPVWFVDEEPLPSEIHAPPSRVARAIPSDVESPQAVTPPVKTGEPLLQSDQPSSSAVSIATIAPTLPSTPVSAAPRPGSRPALRAERPTFPGDGRPSIAIVIDDVGVDRVRGERALALPAEVTLAFMTYADSPRQWGERARMAGHEYLVHVPMQPAGTVDPGPQALLSGLDPDELRRRLRWGLDRWSGYVGANNHMGSRFTESASGMALVMEEMRARNLLFLDSRTSPRSVAGQAAQQAAVPFVERNIFLDNEATPAGLQRQLAVLEDLARKRGQAIAIGHPHDATLAALAAWVPAIEARGVRVVPLTKVMHHA